MATIAELLLLRHQLTAVSDSPGLDVELLLCHCLQKPRSYLKGWADEPVAAQQQTRFQHLFARRLAGEPIAHLIGERGFWTLDLTVNASTLIPRPETELLVEKSLQLLADKPVAQVLDLGTGTGAIALALASERPQWQLLGSDKVPAAVALAETNRKRNGLTNVRFLQSNWFEQLAGRQFDLIVSNPPYIDAADPHLQRGDLRFEPRSALVASEQGLADIRKIIAESRLFLTRQAWLIFEHGYNQAAAVRELLSAAGFEQIFTNQDLAGQDRISGGQFAIGDTVL